MPEQTPSIGRIVHYTLSEGDAETINHRRADAEVHRDYHRANANGVQVHVGNAVLPGQTYPMVITRVWGDQSSSAVNGQVLLDGNDTYWATSATVGEGGGHFAWPTRV